MRNRLQTVSVRGCTWVAIILCSLATPVTARAAVSISGIDPSPACLGQTLNVQGDFGSPPSRYAVQIRPATGGAPLRSWGNRAVTWTGTRLSFHLGTAAMPVGTYRLTVDTFGESGFATLRNVRVADCSPTLPAPSPTPSPGPGPAPSPATPIGVEHVEFPTLQPTRRLEITWLRAPGGGRVLDGQPSGIQVHVKNEGATRECMRAKAVVRGAGDTGAAGGPVVHILGARSGEDSGSSSSSGAESPDRIVTVETPPSETRCLAPGSEQTLIAPFMAPTAPIAPASAAQPGAESPFQIVVGLDIDNIPASWRVSGPQWYRRLPQVMHLTGRVPRYRVKVQITNLIVHNTCDDLTDGMGWKVTLDTHNPGHPIPCATPMSCAITKGVENNPALHRRGWEGPEKVLDPVSGRYPIPVHVVVVDNDPFDNYDLVSEFSLSIPPEQWTHGYQKTFDPAPISGTTAWYSHSRNLCRPGTGGVQISVTSQAY